MLGKFYVTGGIDANNNPLATMEIYDPSSRLWTLGPNMSNPLSGMITYKEKKCLLVPQDFFLLSLRIGQIPSMSMKQFV